MKMKTIRLVLLCTLIVAAIVTIGSCAASRKAITEKDFIEAWSGVWVNEELAGNHLNPQILVNHPDRTMEFFINSAYMESGKKDMRIRNYGVPSITDKWVDGEGRIWYTAATLKGKSGMLLSYYGFIDEAGEVLEIKEELGNKKIEEWDTDDYYLHRVYYRR
jgi:hypothetical protein